MRTLYIVIIVLFCCCVARANDFNPKLDEAIQKYMELDQFSGTVLVAKNGEVLYAGGFGEADKDHHVKNTLKTKFNIGSIGKTFTAIAIMQLVEQGKLNLKDAVKSHLPDFPYGNKITIHHLLTHTSGLYNYFAHPDFGTKMYQVRGVADALELIYDQKLRFETPGEKFSYSNSGIVILGALIEKISDGKYADYIRENILEPAQMFDTGINYFEQVIENRATGYIKSFTGRIKRNIYSAPPANADGGIETTVLDMLNYDQALYGTKLLSEESKKIMFTPFLNDYGYCWGIGSEFGNTVVGHGGGASGISAMFRRYLDDRYVIVVLSNYDRAASPLFNTIEAIVFDQPYSFPKPYLPEFLYNTIIEKGIEFTKQNFDQILTENGYKIEQPWTLNEFGYELLREKQVALAIEIFKVNIGLFPDDANLYDSLGEGYLTAGDSENAIKYYEKALQVDPAFENARLMLDKIRSEL